MSYLHLPSLAMGDIQTGTISLWFRFSQDSVDKAAAYQSTLVHPNAPDVLDFTIPLVTFGREVMAHVYDSISVQVGMTPDSHDPFGNVTPGQPVMASKVVDVGDAPCPPSHIGIVCREGEKPNLVMYFQLDTRATVQGITNQITQVRYEPIGGDYQAFRTLEDVSYIRVGEPESFLVKPKFEVELDKWHHLLVSFDFTGSVDVVGTESDPDTDEELRSITIKSFCKLWFAFDDENKKGKDNMGDGRDFGWVPQDENGIITENAEGAVTSYSTVTDPYTTGAASNPEYHWAASPIPMQDGPMGLPASTAFVETISHCEMAEFQFYGGLVLNTDSVGDRRKFIDASGKPVPPKETEELVGRRPDILLHGSGNWQKGANTGLLGLMIDTDEEGRVSLTELPEGQFTPVALIKKYKPEPALDPSTG